MLFLPTFAYLTYKNEAITFTNLIKIMQIIFAIIFAEVEMFYTGTEKVEVVSFEGPIIHLARPWFMQI